VASKEIAVKKYVVRLSEEERARLADFIRKGKRAGHLLTKARILLIVLKNSDFRFDHNLRGR
jgi:hypothetical protein